MEKRYIDALTEICGTTSVLYEMSDIERYLYLHDLASERQRAGLHPVRRVLHPLYLHPHRHQPCHQGALQDAPLRRHAGRSDHRVAAQEARGSAARIAGSELLPRREIKTLKMKAPDGCFHFR